MLDPNDANVRIFDLIAIDPFFADLIAHPVADRIMSDLLGPDYIVSNFTANIARPGSGSMGVHSDTALVLPEPWLAPVSANVIWCLTTCTRTTAPRCTSPAATATARATTCPPTRWRRWCRSARRPARSW